MSTAWVRGSHTAEHTDDNSGGSDDKLQPTHTHTHAQSSFFLLVHFWQAAESHMFSCQDKSHGSDWVNLTFALLPR